MHYTTVHTGIHEIIQQLILREIPVEMIAEGYRLSGFYKSGSIRLVPRNDDGEVATTGNATSFMTIARYAETATIATFDDLVRLHFSWWERSCDRGVEKWTWPDPLWLADYVRLGLVVAKTVTSYAPATSQD